MTFKAVDVFVLWCTVIANTKSSLVVQNYLAIFFLIPRLPVIFGLYHSLESWYEEKRVA